MSDTPIRLVLACDHRYDTLTLRRLAYQSEQAISLSVVEIPDDADDWPLEDVDVFMVDLSGLLKRGICPADLCDTLYSHVPVILIGESCDGEKALKGIRAGAQDWLIQGQLTKRPLIDVLEFAKLEFFRHRDLIVSQAQYQSVVEDQIHFICRFLPDDRFTLTFVNQAYASKFEQPVSALEGASLLTLTPSRDRLWFQRKIASLTPECPVVSYDRQVVIDGAVHWLHWTDKAIFDSNGIILEVQSVGTDISTLRSGEEPVQEPVSRFQHFFQNVPLMMQELNAKGRIENVNGCWCEGSGYSSHEAIGKHFFRYLTNKDQHEFRSVFDKLIRQGWIKDYECQLVRRDGQLSDVLLSATVDIDADTDALRFLVIVHNVSQPQAQRHFVQLESAQLS